MLARKRNAAALRRDVCYWHKRTCYSRRVMSAIRGKSQTRHGHAAMSSFDPKRTSIKKLYGRQVSNRPVNSAPAAPSDPCRSS